MRKDTENQWKDTGGRRKTRKIMAINKAARRPFLGGTVPLFCQNFDKSDEKLEKLGCTGYL